MSCCCCSQSCLIQWTTYIVQKLCRNLLGNDGVPFLLFPLFGTSVTASFFQALTDLIRELCAWLCSLSGRMSFWIRSVPAADAKMADDASTVTLRIPRPPSFTGRIAPVYWSSLMLKLITSVMHWRWNLLYSISCQFRCILLLLLIIIIIIIIQNLQNLQNLFSITTLYCRARWLSLGPRRMGSVSGVLSENCLLLSTRLWMVVNCSNLW